MKKKLSTHPQKKLMAPISEQRHRPELMDWDWIHLDADASGAIRLRQDEAGKFGKGRIIFTMTPGPGIGDKDMQAIAKLVAFAPELWRVLRQFVVWVDGSDEFFEDIPLREGLHDATDLLWTAVDRFPFKLREIDEDEEMHMKRISAATDEQLAKIRAGRMKLEDVKV